MNSDIGLEWATLEGGCFDMGETRVYPEEGPVTEACIEPYAIMTHEVTNAEFSAFTEATGYLTRAERGWRSDEAGSPGVDLPPSSAVFVPPSVIDAARLGWWNLVEGASWKMPNGPDSDFRPRPEDPVVHVTREDAEAFAAWAGARLPTEMEWEFAARGGLVGELMAWDKSDPETTVSQANTWQGLFPVADTGDDGYAGVAPVGSFPPNGYGLYDMMGNVWEWTASPYSPSISADDRERAGSDGYDPSQPGIPVGAIRGGSYLCAQSYCFRYRPAARQAQDLAFGTSHLGFRLVRLPSES